MPSPERRWLPRFFLPAGGPPFEAARSIDRSRRLRFLALAVVLAASGLAGLAVTRVSGRLLVTGIAALILIGLVALHPQLAAYIYLAVTPLVAGIDRGTVIPFFRPNEALALLVGAGLIARGLVRLRSGLVPKLIIGKTDLSILLMAVAGSVVPLAWMGIRHRPVEQDDILYALIVWKYYGVYLLVRFSIRTEREVRVCLQLSMIAASLVALIAVLQSLQLFGVTKILSHYYTPYGNTQALLNNRGGSTLSLPIASADFLTFNLAIALGFLMLQRKHRALLVGGALLFTAGTVASGEFSALIGLLLALAVVVWATRRVRLLAWFVPGAAAAFYALRPVLERRLSGFQTVSGLPVSWYGRLYNLRNYFWPQLFSHWNFILGVRPAARVSTATMATGFIWIESGYTWLLWSGGIPLLLGFLYFLRINLQKNLPLASRDDAVGVAALSAVVALVVVGVLMSLDPHLTYRGSADLIFSLLALAAVQTMPGPDSGTPSVSSSGDRQRLPGAVAR